MELMLFADKFVVTLLCPEEKVGFYDLSTGKAMPVSWIRSLNNRNNSKLVLCQS